MKFDRSVEWDCIRILICFRMVRGLFSLCVCLSWVSIDYTRSTSIRFYILYFFLKIKDRCSIISKERLWKPSCMLCSAPCLALHSERLIFVSCWFELDMIMFAIYFWTSSVLSQLKYRKFDHWLFYSIRNLNPSLWV